MPGGERHQCPIYYKLGSEFEEEGEKGKPRLPVANADFALVAVGRGNTAVLAPSLTHY